MSNITKKEEVKQELLPTPIMSGQELTQYFNQFKEFVSTQLVEGINDDYGLIPGTKKKTLFKSGAEKLANFFGIYAEPELIDKVIDWEKPFFYFAYRYTAYSVKTGRKLAVGEGSANSKESKFRRNNVYDMENVIRKMAMKRAFVSCILSATRGSFMFTQDMEDYMDSDNLHTVSTQSPPSQTQEKPTPKTTQQQPQNQQISTQSPQGKISNKQWKFLYAKLHQAGFNLKDQNDKDFISALFTKIYGISLKEIDTQTLNDFTEFLEGKTKEDLVKHMSSENIDFLDNPMAEEI